MTVITAPTEYIRQSNDVFCFLAGGITNCKEWQKEVIDCLSEYDLKHLIVFNPRREDFPIHDENASLMQIQWEFEYLQQMDIFSMYFCKSESDQPICMYELGRNLARFADRTEQIVVSVEDGYKRENDVVIQTALATNALYFAKTNATPQRHALHIAQRYHQLVS